MITKGNQPEFRRLGTEDSLDSGARDSRLRGAYVAKRDSVDRPCSPTAVRAHFVPSPRAVQEVFATPPKPNIPCDQTSSKGTKT